MKERYKKLISILIISVLLLIIAFLAATIDLGPREEDKDTFTKTTLEVSEDGATNQSAEAANNIYYVPVGSPDKPTAAGNKSELKEFLPIYIEDFETSVGITTTINIFDIEEDEKNTIRLEIYGIDYHNDNADPAVNLDVTAFKESFEKAKDEIRIRGVNPKHLHYIFGSRVYVRETADKWVRTLSLL